ncbi:MAG: opacity protein-like surface antigen [Bermanella sp.]|jgi:opacity protein-like surface antigen
MRLIKGAFNRDASWKATAIVCLSLLTGLSSPAWARDAWYVGASSYDTTFNNNTVDDRERITSCNVITCTAAITASDYRAKFDTDRHPAIAFGFLNRNGWRSEFEYSQADFGIRSPKSKETSIESRQAMASFWRDFNYGNSPLGTYAGFGLGVGQLKQGLADDKFVMAQGGVGLTYAVTRELTLDLGYRLFTGEPDITLDDSNRAIDLDYSGHSYALGLRYYMY